MSENNLSILSAIQIAMEAERKAAAAYADAATKSSNPLAKQLFTKLNSFETYHLEKLAELLESLAGQKGFIEYTAQDPLVPAPSEVPSVPQAERMSMMSAIKMAQENELQAKDRYLALVEQTDHLTGKRMFEQLAAEEEAHYRLLRDIYWNLNDRSVWAWT